MHESRSLLAFFVSFDSTFAKLLSISGRMHKILSEWLAVSIEPCIVFFDRREPCQVDVSKLESSIVHHLIEFHGVIPCRFVRLLRLNKLFTVFVI